MGMVERMVGAGLAHYRTLSLYCGSALDFLDEQRVDIVPWFTVQVIHDKVGAQKPHQIRQVLFGFESHLLADMNPCRPLGIYLGNRQQFGAKLLDHPANDRIVE